MAPTQAMEEWAALARGEDSLWIFGAANPKEMCSLVLVATKADSMAAQRVKWLSKSS